MLQGTDLYKKYGSVQVLNGISVDIKQGEVVSIVGASGAGKSTLLHILGTLDTPDSGAVYLNDVNVSQANAKEIAKIRNEKIGFVFQFHNLMAELTALENICLPAYIAQKPKAEAEQKAMELLETLNLGHRADHLPSQMSGGEMQRVAVARALINSPAMVFADEPSGNLDSKNANELHDLFFSLRNKYGFGIVIVTHNTELARSSDRVLELKDGRILI
jgi:lipoprotein-releasing system ATP-binding protein